MKYCNLNILLTPLNISVLTNVDTNTLNVLFRLTLTIG